MTRPIATADAKADIAAAEAPLATRRAFLERGALVLGGFALGSAARPLAAETTAPPALRIGLVTDVHYADRAPAGTRFYRESLVKLREAVEKFNAEGVDLAVEIGDFIDEAADVPGEIAHLRAAEAVYSQFQGPRHYVLGNHCVWTLTKEEFLDHSAMEQPYYAFAKGSFRFIVLDACHRADGVAYGRKNFEWTDTAIPAEQLEWLRGELAGDERPAILFVHQRLDLDRGLLAPRGRHAVTNAADVRRILEQSGRVLAVFQGHSHQNDYRLVGGIHYCVARAMVEGSGPAENGYAVLNLYGDGSLRIDGFRKQQIYEWPRG